VGVSSVRTTYVVALLEVGADTGGDCLFADVQVDEARDFSFAVGASGSFLKSPQQQHPAIQVKKRFTR
jgi:hypothetical protein